MKYLLITLLILCSCTPQRRFTRLVTKHPELLITQYEVIHDTVKITVPKVKVDTVFLIKNLKDTVFLTKEQLKIKLWTVHDSIFVDGQCDTVKIESVRAIRVPVKIYEKTPIWKKVTNFIIFLCIIYIILYALFRLIKKYIL